MKASTRGAGKRHHARDGLVKTIGAFKLVKALLLIGVGLGALNLLNPANADTAYRWASSMAWRLGPRAASRVEHRLSNLHESQLKLVAVVALLYAALFAVEGVGLLMSKRWAEYLTIVATSSFVPFEAYELVKKVSWQRVATLAINLLVVGYLIWKVRQPRDSTAGREGGRRR
ncbi:MAG: DUF2127 domain-containing protein [Acidobacteriota bacterium]